MNLSMEFSRKASLAYGEACKPLCRELNLPQTLTEAGVAPGKVWNAMEEIVKSVLADPCCKTNPVPVEDFQVRRILEEVTGHI